MRGFTVTYYVISLERIRGSMKMRRQMADLLPPMQQYIMQETKNKYFEDPYSTLSKVFRQ